jgi:hypothetical protein
VPVPEGWDESAAIEACPVVAWEVRVWRMYKRKALRGGRHAAAQGGMAGMSSTNHGGTTSTHHTGHSEMAGMWFGHHGRSGQGGMEGMGSKHQGGMADAGSGHRGGAEAGTADAASTAHFLGWLDVLLRWGPEILVISVVSIVASVALRRRWAALPAIGGGLILYVGMYAQPKLALMHAAIAVGTVLLLVAYVISVRPARTESVNGLAR